MGTRSRLTGVVAVYDTVRTGDTVREYQLFASSSLEHLANVFGVPVSDVKASGPLALELVAGYSGWAVPIFLKQVLGGSALEGVDVCVLKRSKLSPEEFFTQSSEQVRLYMAKYIHQERLERLYAHGLTLDEAVNTVNSLKSELVKCTTYRRPTLPIEEKIHLLGKMLGCPRVSTNLVGIIKRTKNPVRAFLRDAGQLLPSPSIEAHFQCDEQRFTYRRDPYYVKLRGALVKTYCGAMKALARGRNSDYVNALVKAKELEDALFVFVDSRSLPEPWREPVERRRFDIDDERKL